MGCHAGSMPRFRTAVNTRPHHGKPYSLHELKRLAASRTGAVTTGLGTACRVARGRGR